MCQNNISLYWAACSVKCDHFCTRRLIVSRTKDRSRVVKRVLFVAVRKNAKLLGCVVQDIEPQKIKTILRKGTQLTQTPCANCENRVAICLHSVIKRSNDGELFNSPVFMSAARVLTHLKIFSRREVKTRAMRPQGCMGIGQKRSQAQQETQSNILLTFGCSVSSSAIHNKTRKKRVCCGFQSINAHAEQERPEFG